MNSVTHLAAALTQLCTPSRRANATLYNLPPRYQKQKQVFALSLFRYGCALLCSCLSVVLVLKNSDYGLGATVSYVLKSFTIYGAQKVALGLVR